MAFIRRLHDRSFLGFLDLGWFHVVLSPDPFAPAAHVLALKADFPFSFVPSPNRRRTGRWAGRWSI
uniref:Uncharacterized protein n=1 Tax=Aegilops tauschii TaxID=37682 RepID=N1QYA6_AEGTA